MASKYGYRFARRAAGDVTGIVDYMAGELANPEAAAAFKKKLGECIDNLRVFPKSGSPVHNRCVWKKGICKTLVGSYVLFYFPDEAKQTIQILRVVYGARDMDEVLKGLSS